MKGSSLSSCLCVAMHFTATLKDANSGAYLGGGWLGAVSPPPLPERFYFFEGGPHPCIFNISREREHYHYLAGGKPFRPPEMLN